MARRDGYSRGLESLEEIRASDRFIEQLRVSGTYEPSTRADAALAAALLSWRDEARLDPLSPPPSADEVDLDGYAQPRRIARRAVAVAAAAGLRLRRGTRAVGGAVGSVAGSAARSTRAAARATRGKLASAFSLRALRRHPWTDAIATALAVAVVISTVWWASYDDSTEAQDGPEAPDSSLAVTASSGPAAVAAAMDECRSTWHAQAEPLEAAAKSLQQWQVHIDAMNQLVAGEITLEQASAFWEQTRKHAAHNVRHFQRADDTYQADQHSCGVLDVARNTDPGLAALTACQQSVAHRDDTLGAARVAIGTWHHHVMDMNMMRAGTLSPTRALQRWNKYWKQGVAELDDYRTKLRQTDGPSC